MTTSGSTSNVEALSLQSLLDIRRNMEKIGTDGYSLITT